MPERSCLPSPEEKHFLTAIPPVKTPEQKFAQVVTYIHSHLSDQITLEQTALCCQISASSVSKLFRKFADTSFHKYLTQCRISAAEELILLGIPLEQLHQSVGYQDHSSFYRAFVKVHGCSPRVFRNRARENL